MRAPRYYKNPYTAIILTDWDPAFEEAMKGESWYKIRASYDPKQQLVLDSLPSLNN